MATAYAEAKRAASPAQVIAPTEDERERLVAFTWARCERAVAHWMIETRVHRVISALHPVVGLWRAYPLASGVVGLSTSSVRRIWNRTWAYQPEQTLGCLPLAPEAAGDVEDDTVGPVSQEAAALADRASALPTMASLSDEEAHRLGAFMAAAQEAAIEDWRTETRVNRALAAARSHTDWLHALQIAGEVCSVTPSTAHRIHLRKWAQQPENAGNMDSLLPALA